tara:strand:+ start:536 stop:763 length:228 start_codon:yes stop_codon:yes gene_type:complete
LVVVEVEIQLPHPQEHLDLVVVEKNLTELVDHQHQDKEIRVVMVLNHIMQLEAAVVPVVLVKMVERDQLVPVESV